MSLIFTEQSEIISSLDSSFARSKISLRFCRSCCESSKNFIIVSKYFFSLIVFFTLLLSFQKFSLAIKEFKLFNFVLILFVSKVPPNII